MRAMPWESINHWIKLSRTILVLTCMATKKNITQKYLYYIQTEGDQNHSVAQFCKENKIKEEDFFKHFPNLKSIESSFWEDKLNQTINRLEKEENYQAGSAREKMLFFFFSFIEDLSENRSYILFRFESKRDLFKARFLQKFNKTFMNYSQSVVEEGMESREIAKIPVVNQQLHKPLVMNLLFVIDFWCKDESEDFELTDAAIEKSINLAFDLMGSGAVNNAVDFGKFLVQQYRFA